MTDKLKRAALSAFTSLMKPTAHIMLRCGISWKELTEALKRAYVETAIREFGKYGRPANTSRVAILTGLSRKEVRRVRDLIDGTQSDGPGELERINRATRLLSAWHQDPDFVTAGGKPRLLTSHGPKGFEALAKRYAPDIPATAMLKELQSVGAVGTTPSGKHRALARSFIPPGLDAESVARFGSVASDIGATIAHNLLNTQKRPRFERRATNFSVKRVSRSVFQKIVEERGMDMLTEMDQWLTSHETADPSEKPSRLGVGIYLIWDD